MNVPVVLRSPGEVVAAIPALLGFHPNDSLVALWTSAGTGTLVCTVRLDLVLGHAPRPDVGRGPVLRGRPSASRLAVQGWTSPAQAPGRVTFPSSPYGRRDDGRVPVQHPTQLSVQLLHVADCPSAEVAAIRLRLALDATDHDGTPIEFVLVRTDEQARDLGFRGSPTMLINGRDPFVTTDTQVGLACRLYRTETGTSGAPTLEQFVDAIQRALKQ